MGLNELVLRVFYEFLSSGSELLCLPLVVCQSVCPSLEKMSKIVKNCEFGLHLKTKVTDLLKYTKKNIYGLCVCPFVCPSVGRNKKIVAKREFLSVQE